jgi:ribosomal protein S18 acetylase RimI-like enzyme
VSSADLAGLRSLLGASAALWAGAAGTGVEAGRWVALSRARSVDYNVILCHAKSEIARSVEEISGAGVPGLIMVAGAALGEVQQLAAAGWVCIGAVPFMARELEAGESLPDSDLRELEGAEDLALAHGLISDVFGLEPGLAEVAVRTDELASPGRRLWGAFDGDGSLVACLATVASGDAVVIWSMATSANARRRGHGRRLLDAALADAAEHGARLSLLHASEDGEPFYRTAGYSVLERWQVWSRPRWVLGRA